VVDIRLPDIDGIKLVKIMKFKYPGVPIILITGYADRYNMEEIKNLQVNAFMEKPFTPDELCQQFIRVLAEQQAAAPAVEESKEEARSQSAYMLLKLDDDADFFETYQQLYYMDSVLYCDATKGDYDIFLLIQSDSMENCKKICETGIKKVKGVKSVDFLEVERPVLDDITTMIINTAEDALSDESPLDGKNRDLGQRVCSYVLLDVEREKLQDIYPTLRLDEQVIFCDYTTGKYNLILFVTGSYFDEIDRFIQEKVITLDGVLKVK
jgi:DNA-binding Lrp family transcriptional regulator